MHLTNIWFLAVQHRKWLDISLIQREVLSNTSWMDGAQCETKPNRSICNNFSVLFEICQAILSISEMSYYSNTVPLHSNYEDIMRKSIKCGFGLYSNPTYNTLVGLIHFHIWWLVCSLTTCIYIASLYRACVENVIQISPVRN